MCTATKERAPIRAAKAKLPTPPKGCLSSVQVERWFIATARAAEASAKLVIDRMTATFDAVTEKSSNKTKGPTAPAHDFHDEIAIAKHRDTAIKAMRAATELALRREDDELVSNKDAEIAARGRGATN